MRAGPDAQAATALALRLYAAFCEVYAERSPDGRAREGEIFVVQFQFFRESYDLALASRSVWRAASGPPWSLLN